MQSAMTSSTIRQYKLVISRCMRRKHVFLFFRGRRLTLTKFSLIIDTLPSKYSKRSRWIRRSLHKHDSHLLCLDFRSLPVINVILKVPIANTKLEILEEGIVFHDVQRVENVASALSKKVCDRVHDKEMLNQKMNNTGNIRIFLCMYVHYIYNICTCMHMDIEDSTPDTTTTNQCIDETSLAIVRQSCMRSLRGTVFAML